MTHDELEQRLWELEYGLLSDEDAAVLRARIADDVSLGQLHDHIRTQVSLVAQAARIAGPRIPLQAPDANANANANANSNAENSPFAATPAAVRPSASSARIKRSATWSLGIASSLLFGLLSWSALSTTGPQFTQVANATRGVEAPPSPASSSPASSSPASSSPASSSPASSSPAAKLAGPQSTVIIANVPRRLSREANTPATILTRSADGTPQATQLQLRMDDPNGASRLVEDFSTNEQGRAVIELPKSDTDTAQLSFAFARGVQPALKVNLEAAETQYATHVATDKPRYRPGEVVRYRSVTLSRFGLKADRDMPVEFQITDPAGQEIAGSKTTGTTERGVGNGELELTVDAAPGQYTLFARSPTQTFPEVKRDFTVHSPAPRQYDVDVNWADTWYKASGQAQGKLTVRTPAGEPAKSLKLGVRAFVDGFQVATDELMTDAEGKADVQFGLPPQVASTEGELGILAGQQEVIWKEIPLQADQVQVDFYPEGGDLTAGVENRVYLHAHDSDGRPVKIGGRIVDGGGREFAAVKTEPEGRSAFRFVPELGATYSLVIDDPATIQSRPPLPPVREESRLALDAAPGVFDGGSPVHLKLRSRTPPAEFLLVAYCRGVLVGQRVGTAAEFRDGSCDVDLPVIAEAAGVLRLTVFDSSRDPTEPLAERLVYRRPQQRLQLEWSGLSTTYATGDKVRGEVTSTDEAGQPISAVLGISAVDRTVLELAGRTRPRIAAQFLMLGDVNNPEKLEDANFFLSPNPSAAIALDLLLGTQGWRRFERVAETRLAGVDQLSKEGLAAGFGGGGVGAAAGLAGGAAGSAGKSLAEEKSPLFSGALGRLSEVMDDAPRQIDNRYFVEDLRQESTRELSVSPAAPVVQTQNPTRRTWIAVASFGLLLIAGTSAVIRRYPTRSALIWGVVAVAGSLALLCVVTLFVNWIGNSVVGDTRRGPIAESASVELQMDTSGDVAGVESAPMKPDQDARYDYRAMELHSKKAEQPAGVSDPMSAKLEPSAPKAANPIAPAAPADPAAAPLPAALPAAAPIPPPAPLATPATPAPAPVASDPAPAPVLAPKSMRDEGATLEQKVKQNSRFAVAPKNLNLDKQTWKATDQLQRRIVDRPTEVRMRSQLGDETVRAKVTDKKVDKEKELEKATVPSTVETLPARRMADEKGALGGYGKPGGGVANKVNQQLKTTVGEQKPNEAAESSADRFVVRRYAWSTTPAKGVADRKVLNYAESVFWDPLVVTDEQGRASFEFFLPDTVTEFRILAEGHQDGRLGDSERTITVEPSK